MAGVYLGVFADPFCQVFIDFSMSRDSTYFLLFSVHINGMVSALPQEFATILFDVSD